MRSATGAVRARVAGLRPPRDRYALTRDALLWAVLATPVLTQAGVRAVDDQPWWPLVIGTAVLAGLVRVSRTSPVAALVGSVALALIDPSFSWALPVTSYFVGRRAAGHRLPVAAFTVLLATGAVLAAFDVVSWVHLVVGFAFLGITPWLLGRYRRQHVALVHAGWHRAEHLEREQRIVSEQARLRERARISQDMHDSLGHELSLIALQAAHLEVTAATDDDQRTRAGELRQRAGAATEQLREIIGLLREDAETAPTEPSSQSITELVRRCRDAGMIVTADLDAPGRAGPPVADRAAYRVVQEALTNAAKHAPGAEVTVRVRRTAEATTVSVINPLVEPDPVDRPAGSQGLLGLRERARLLGGTFTAGSGSGVFEVTASLPHDAGRGPSDGPAEVHESTTTESAAQRARADREVRRSLVVAVTGSALMAAVILTVQVFVWMHNAQRSYLSPAEYGRIVVGDDRARVAEVLPPEQLPSRPARAEPDAPAGAVCEYYSSENNVLGAGPVYRLCFSDGRLVSKDVLRQEEDDA